MLRPLTAMAAILALAACSVGPDYTPPDPKTPATWNDPSVKKPGPKNRSNITMESNPDPHWWESFNDPELNSLVTRAAGANLSLRQTVLRIEEARADEVGAASAGLPHLTGNASYMRDQEGLRGLVNESGYNTTGTNNTGTDGNTTSGLLNKLYQPFDLFQDSLNASWEIDLFGRVRRSVEESQANVEAMVEARNDALVSAEAQVAQSYAQLRGAQAQDRIAAEDIKVETDVLNLTKDRVARGLASDLDVDNAQTQLDTTTASLPTFQQQTQQAANALAVLLALPPGALDGELTQGQTVPTLPPDIPIGMPSTLAERRPDIREAAAKLHQATAALGVAVAQTYPDVTLTGEVGTRALEAHYLTHWSNLFYSYGPAVSLPIFEGGQLTSNIDLTTAEQKEAALQYQQTVLNALQEVENALAAYRADRARQVSLADTVKSAQDGLMLATDRYRHGLSSFIDVLTTENQLVTARQQYTDSALSVTVDVIQLYRALGGGWQDIPTPDTTPSDVPQGLDILDAVAVPPLAAATAATTVPSNSAPQPAGGAGSQPQVLDKPSTPTQTSATTLHPVQVTAAKVSPNPAMVLDGSQ